MAEIDLTGRVPAWPQDACRLMAACLSEALHGADSWQSPPREGDEGLRAQIARIGGWRDTDVYVTTGVRGAALALLRGRRRLVLEAPSYRGIARLAGGLGLEVCRASWDGMPSYAAGPDCVTWVTSPYRNPDGASVTAGQCTAIAAGAGRLVQNVIYGLCRGTGPVADGAILVGSLGKLAGGGVRVGWAVGGGFAEIAAADLRAATPPLPWQRAWASFLARGGADLLLEAVVRPAEAARRAFVSAADWLGYTGCAVPDGGPFLLVPLPHGVDEQVATRLAHANGVRVGPGRDFDSPVPAVRLCFTTVTTTDAQIAAERLGFLGGEHRMPTARPGQEVPR